MSADKVFSKQYRYHWYEEVVLQIGEVTWTRHEMITKLENGHFQAAQQLTKIFKRLDVRTAVQIRRIGILDWARLSGVGEAKLKILVDLLVYNGDEDRLVERWLTRPYGDDARVRQWSALCAVAAKRGKRRGAHAA